MTMEALHDMIRNRMLNSIRLSSFRQVPWNIMRRVIGNAMTAYWTIRNDLVSEVDVLPEFLATFGFSQDVMDLEANMAIADDWDQVPNHSTHTTESCDLCTELAK